MKMHPGVPAGKLRSAFLALGARLGCAGRPSTVSSQLQRAGFAACAWLFVLAGLTALVVTGCVSARRTEPIAPPLQLSDATLQRGQLVFYQQCHFCHPHGGAGLGPAIVNKPLPGFLMKIQVRHGLGAMPSFKADKLSSEDLASLVAYLKAVHANKPDSTKVRG
jgi:mono/diheme cytochrome c family protein